MHIKTKIFFTYPIILKLRFKKSLRKADMIQKVQVYTQWCLHTAPQAFSLEAVIIHTLTIADVTHK